MSIAAMLSILFFAGLVLLLVYHLRSSRDLQRSLQDSEKLYNSIMVASPDGIVITDLAGRITKASRAALQIFGYTEAEALGLCVFDLITPEDRKRARTEMIQKIRGTYNGETANYRVTRADGDVFYLEVNAKNIKDLANNSLGIVMVCRDISKRKQQEEDLAESNRKLAALSATDALTGIANRHRFEEMLDYEYSRHIRLERELAIILMDIDHFKAYNDFYGHVKGDECLRKVAKTLEEGVFRSYDLVARYGGEEFVFILPDTSIKGALLVAERIRQDIVNLAISHEASDTASVVTASFGVVSSYCTAGRKAFDIVEEADKMLYHAKSSGRNQVASDQKEFTWEPDNIYFTPLRWNASYSCGNSLIDEQHQALFNSINELLKIVYSPSFFEKVVGHVEGMLNILATHFRDEERILYDVGFPEVKNHAREHEKLFKIAQYLLQQYKESRLPVNNLFLFFAYELIEQHVLRVDSTFYNTLTPKLKVD
ncbi:MAG: diguanylate cyclase [Fibromonadaceae bacterium]|jgi:diguanylate cyclase (GGDEF)-like protein/PAS domain S-box-containing protein/hemerythrin-like metal-binding protein|nr:diguanylate cyclase [Fibromonadaceae bacterium]